MNVIYSIILVLCWNSFASCQTTRMITSLPAALAENSGMLIGNDNAIWLHNDGGDSAKLYLIDTFGTIQRTILVTNATNVDWEDITYDPQGAVYIGDFGNNANARQDLKVYKIPHPDSIVGNTVTAEIIHYHYPEQTAFPPINSEKKYDTEAMVYFQDSLYFFTKDRTSPHLGYTWMYAIVADTGNHAAVLLDSFRTNQISYIFEVTAASLSPNNDYLTLLGANQVWLFSNFVGNRFFDGTVQAIGLNSFSQKEAIDFVDSTRLYFSNEASFLGGAALGELDLSSLWLGQKMVVQENIHGFTIYPNPVDEQVQLAFHIHKPKPVVCKLLDASGRCLRKTVYPKLPQGKQQINWSLGKIERGVYFVHLKCGQQNYIKRLVIAR